MVAPGPTASSPPAPARRGLPLWADIPSFTAFAHEVEDALQTPELRYSQRLHLLARAKHFGISRFDANLVIAMVQHRMQRAGPPIPDEPPRRFSMVTLTAAAITQMIIVAAVWWLIM